MAYEPNNIDVPKGIEINLPAHIREQINQKLDENIAVMKYDIQEKISNIQLDMIRQFMQQESQIEDQLNTIAIHNKSQKEIIKKLTSENQKLRGIHFWSILRNSNRIRK